MSEPIVTIKPICATDWTPLRTEVFVRYEGHTYYSRLNYMLSDSPQDRAVIAQQFLQRLKAHPSITQQKEKSNGILDSRSVRRGLRSVGGVAEATPGKGRNSAGGTAGDATSIVAFDKIQGRVEAALNSDIIDFAKKGAPPAVVRKPVHGGHPESDSHKLAPGEWGQDSGDQQPARKRPSFKVIK